MNDSAFFTSRSSEHRRGRGDQHGAQALHLLLPGRQLRTQGLQRLGLSRRGGGDGGGRTAPHGVHVRTRRRTLGLAQRSGATTCNAGRETYSEGKRELGAHVPL